MNHSKSRITALTWASTMFLAIVVMAGCSTDTKTMEAVTSKPKPIIIRLGDVVADDSPLTAAQKFFGKRVSELTNAKYEVQVFPNSTLGSHSTMNKQVSEGTLEMAGTNSADMVEYDKSLSILSLPYLFDSKAKLFKELDAKFGKAYSAVTEKYGFKILGYFDSGARNIYDKKGAIKTPDDIKKMNLRLRTIPNPVMIDTMNALGAQAVPLNTSEIYNAIQQGVVDGAENSITFFITSKHNEIAPYFNLTNHIFSIDLLMISAKWFNALPADDQKAITQAGEDAVKFEREEWAKIEDQNLKQAESLGVKINRDVDVAAFKSKVQPVWDKYSLQFGELYQILKNSQ
jgi:tripartite ATP-independent transporter DctP family solute receptor